MVSSVMELILGFRISHDMWGGHSSLCGPSPRSIELHPPLHSILSFLIIGSLILFHAHYYNQNLWPLKSFSSKSYLLWQTSINNYFLLNSILTKVISHEPTCLWNTNLYQVSSAFHGKSVYTCFILIFEPWRLGINCLCVSLCFQSRLLPYTW